MRGFVPSPLYFHFVVRLTAEMTVDVLFFGGGRGDMGVVGLRWSDLME